MAAGRSGRAGRSRAQATVEFAIVAPLFFLCLLASVDAGLWAVQNSAEVSAVEQGARDAASAAAGSSPGAQPDARAVAADITGRLHLALFGTRVVPWCAPAVTAGCGPAPCPDSPAAVQAIYGPRVVAVCVSESQPPRCTTPAGAASPQPEYCTDTPMVSVRIVGYIAALVPPGFGVGTQAGEVATDVGATTHTLRFAP